jgi:hypothetical protein
VAVPCTEKRRYIRANNLYIVKAVAEMIVVEGK